jgi:hypothetical protein
MKSEVSETQTATGGSFYSTAAIEPKHLFPSAVERVFNLLDALTGREYTYVQGERRPERETIQWAKNVVLGVVPSYYLRTAEIDAFEGEVHVSWERGKRRVVAFLPSPGVLKIYAEWETEEGETKHLIRPLEKPHSIKPFLEWLYQ